MLRRVFFILILILSIAGCELIDLRSLDVRFNVNPYGFLEIGESLVLRFNIELDKHSAFDALRMHMEGRSLELESTWLDSKTVSLRPVNTWQPGALYTLTMNASIKASDSGIFKVYEQLPFFYGNPDNKLRLLSFSIPPGEVIDTTDSLVYTFNRPVKMQGFKNSFNLLPFADYRLEFSDDLRIITVVPLQDLPINTVFKWHIRDLKSDDDYVLDKMYDGWFLTPADTVFPEVIEICPVLVTGSDYIFNHGTSIDNALLQKQPIGVVFSKSMNFQTIRNALNITPSLAGTLRQADADGRMFVFMPSDFYTPLTRYNLFISTSALDNSGLRLRENVSVFFNTQTDFLRVVSILDQNNESFNLDESVISISTLDGNRLEIDISFDKSIPVDLRAAAVSKIAVVPHFPSIANYPTLFQVRWSLDGFSVRLFYRGLSVSDALLQYAYRIVVTGKPTGITTGSGEHMEDDVCVYFYTY